MAKQITSHNQQGGITAEKVTVDGDVTTNVTPPKRSRWKLWTVIGAAAAIVTILSYFGFDWENDTMGDNYDVTSHNQQGGITAGQVNFGKPQRQLDAILKQQLDKLLANHADKEVQITTNLPCEDGPQFARQMKAYLEERGFKVADVKTALLPIAPNKLEIDVSKPIIQIYIS